MDTSAARGLTWWEGSFPGSVEPVRRSLEVEQRDGIREVFCQMLLVAVQEEDPQGR